MLVFFLTRNIRGVRRTSDPHARPLAVPARHGAAAAQNVGARSCKGAEPPVAAAGPSVRGGGRPTLGRRVEAACGRRNLERLLFGPTVFAARPEYVETEHYDRGHQKNLNR